MVKHNRSTSSLAACNARQQEDVRRNKLARLNQALPRDRWKSFRRQNDAPTQAFENACDLIRTRGGDSNVTAWTGNSESMKRSGTFPRRNNVNRRRLWGI